VPRAVLDTNVLVAALISGVGAPAGLLLALRVGAFELVVSPALLAELREVLRRDRFRAYVTLEQVDAYVAIIERDAMVIADPPPSTGPPVASDPDDEFLVTLARAARVNALVSGDARLLELAGRLPVMTPRAFLDTLDVEGSAGLS
jgi:putative PIN family toxin of toxin-antitoxin system